MTDKKFRAWIIVPCYNEEKRLRPRCFAEYISSREDVGFCFVNDGSCDGTMDVLRRIVAPFPGRTAILDLKTNGGKGEAVRAGVRHVSEFVSSEYIGFWDADLATPLGEIDDFLDILDSGEGFVVTSGSRIPRMGAFIERTPLRDLEGRIFASLSSGILGLKFRDTQCGAKLFDSSLAADVFGRPFISRWCFDVELFARLRDILGPSRMKREVCEVPLKRWTEVAGSKVTLGGTICMILDLGRILLYYGRAA